MKIVKVSTTSLVIIPPIQRKKRKGKPMKPTIQLKHFYFAMLILAVVHAAGCDTTGRERAKEATTSMQTMENEIKSIAMQLDATGVSLEALMRPGQPDVKKAFALYTENVSKMEDWEKSFAKHADEMKARGKDYFEEWQKEGNTYKNPRIQELSDQRRLELGEIYGRIAETSIGVRDAFKSYVSNAKEAQNYLSNDLTPNGIEAFASIGRKVVQDGDNLKYAIRNVQNAIATARTEMTQGGR